MQEPRSYFEYKKSKISLTVYKNVNVGLSSAHVFIMTIMKNNRLGKFERGYSGIARNAHVADSAVCCLFIKDTIDNLKVNKN